MGSQITTLYLFREGISYEQRRITLPHFDRPKYLFWQTMYSGTPHLGFIDLGFIASGISVKEILREYPDLEEADILACIAYGAEMTRERYVDIPFEANA